MNYRVIFFTTMLSLGALHAAQTPGVRTGYALHNGTQIGQCNQLHYEDFVIANNPYHLAVMTTGYHGNQAAHVVKTNMSPMIKRELTKQFESKKSFSYHDVLRNVFTLCENIVVFAQDKTKIQSTACVAVSLWDLTKKRSYMAHIGNIRVLHINKQGRIVWQSQDHDCTDDEEKKFVMRHGGAIINRNVGGTYAPLLVTLDGGDSEQGVPVSRALGNPFLKSYQGKDNKMGPLHATVSANEAELTEEYVEVFVSPGVTWELDHVYPNRSLECCWADIIGKMRSRHFMKHYGMIADNQNISLVVEKNDMGGNDKHLKKAAKRFIYALRWISGNEGELGNMAVLLRTHSLK